MPVYQQHGKIPHKRHVQFRRPTGELYHEELVGTQGFSGASALVYHLHPPTIVSKKEKPYSVLPEIAVEKNLSALSFQGFHLHPDEDYLDSRVVLFMNNDLRIALAAPMQSMTDYFFKNADADEMIFIHEGSGLVRTMYGELPFEYGDYVVIPRGTIYQIHFDTPDNRLLIVESTSPIRTPRRYSNDSGQLLEHSPFCERDFKLPKNLETHDEAGEFKVMIKKQDMMYPYTYATHPFDIVGWDGYHYPYAISIHDFEPLTGRIHMPPPIHQQFEADGFVVCSFVPRLYDYHPDAIPAPYHHSNIDSDEILYYVDGDFMSRNDIRKGQLTLHPGGIPHGPHPGAIERSIGKKGTNELAVMIDPFHPVKITKAALQLEVDDYYKSWLGYAKEVEA
ncbi:MAG: homogentisate 1,2-dioxygenase [Saprospiraceae bacterium]|nr:homogentisate 1,2-dioxygenase [Candidatus Opimibacter iunctus]